MRFPLLPMWKVDSITELTPAILEEKGIRLLMLDFDNTIVPYTTSIPTEEMDRMVTELFLHHGLIPRGLIGTEGVTGVLRPYGAGEPSRAEQAKGGVPYDGVSLKELLEQPDGGEDILEKKGQEYLYIASVRMEAEGTENAFLSLLDDLETHYPQLRMKAFSLKENKIHCELELYFCGK